MLHFPSPPLHFASLFVRCLCVVAWWPMCTLWLFLFPCILIALLNCFTPSKKKKKKREKCICDCDSIAGLIALIVRLLCSRLTYFFLKNYLFIYCVLLLMHLYITSW
uniref:Uncharacterized protein n=1 Tax=Trypanosoma congolense (strain IL3000) TaxID=1068625 RepID=G0UMK6_TRYCI|nr:hypothetical protein, unlikely [Trypanosoma congolense IL3000]